MDQLNDLLKLGKEGNFYSQAPLFVELLASIAAKNRPIVLVSKNSADLLVRIKNLRFFAGAKKIRVFPADERTVMHATAADPLIRMEKMATAFYLTNELPNILVVPPEALLEKLPSVKALQKHAQLLIKGEKINREQLIRSLVILGYTKVPTVLDRGAFAVRGSIIDIFINGEEHPIRLDLFGDEIDSIRYFDEITQRNMHALDSIIVGNVKEVILDDESKTLAEEKLQNLADALNYPTIKLNEKLKDIDSGIHFYGIEKLLPAFYDKQASLLELLKAYKKEERPLFIFDDKEAILSELKRFSQSIFELHEQSLLRQELLFPVEDYFLTVDEFEKYLAEFSLVNISSFIKKDDAKSFESKSTEDIRQDILKASTTIAKDEEPHLLKPLADRLKKLQKDRFTTVVTVSSYEHEKELKRLLEPMGVNLSKVNDMDWLLENPSAFYQPHIHAYTRVCKNPLAFGGIFDFIKLALIAEDDIFGKRTKRKDQSGKQRGFKTAISDLEVNDLVVHVDHGVGQFKGLVRLNVRGVDNDYVLLLYANDEKLYLPTHRINLIKPHGANKDGLQRLDKLGGTAWISKKKKVKEAVMAMAQDLLNLYAKREVVTRPAFNAPDTHYVEFEANFEFETTHDQQKAIDDVLSDMQKLKPMDRLVCGDVGYGKTEVAMRAAMMAVLSKKQVALLSPTTVLAQQHGLTFMERFKNTGASIAVLSRFQKTSEIKEVIKKLEQNQVDIVIGTHRLLSSDVKFKDLGLIIVDEEQRFGIKAKEHLKKMRTKVDVLTMSATPIPRTMQMSYFGIRDLSIIETPPVDRRAIQTQVVQFDDAVIREAIMRELSRGGQVYFVHNRVQSIAATAEYLKDLVPEAKMAIAHGQMNEKDLEKVMLSFIEHKVNLLVCTTIIETGIDVSTANTMFINDADDFGLSQLYQLRGRIGRSKERAFAYLLIKQKTEDLTPIARTRLEILHKFSELGAGFRIAQHDLELRGAGDLLGKNQHGHMAAVGYDLYAELLQEAVKELKGQVEDDVIDPEVVLPISALIPEKYCPELHDRMTFYQRLATADNLDTLDSAINSLEELYGEAPPEVLALKVSTELKIELKELKAIKMDISLGKDKSSLVVSTSLSQNAPLDHQKLLAAIKEPKNLRVTPQHKIIQTINIASTDLLKSLADAGALAIKTIKAELF